MGGLAGHLNHLYDNPNLSFGQIKDVLTQASGGKLLGTEKIDGINIFLSFSNSENKAKAARNKGNIRSGGLDAAGLEKKFSDRPGLAETFKEAIYSWEQAVLRLNPQTRQKIFGEDAEIYYNVEVLEPSNPNVVQYDQRNLIVHQTGHAFFDRKTGNIKDVDVTANYQVLKTAIDKLQQAGHQGGNFRVANDAVQTLKKLNDKKPLELALTRLQKIQSVLKLEDNNTVGDYVSAKVLVFLKKEIPALTPASIRDLTKKILGQGGLRLDKILVKVPEEYHEKVKAIANNPAFILKKAIAPLENVIHDFSVEVLKGLQSAFILDNDKEVKRLRGEVAQAIQAIQNSGQEQAISILQQQLTKLKGAENVFTASEGFVFTYDGLTYKFTGNFAPVNQILGLFKYGRGSIAPMKDIVKESSKNRIIALVPGGFKPPHMGHYLGAKYLADVPNVDEVKVVISPKSRFDSTEQVEFTAEQSLKVWQIYIKNDPKITVEISRVASPVRDVYDMIAEMNPGDTLVLGMGEKDMGDARFDKAQAWSDKNNLGVKIKPILTDVGKYSNISATKVRDLVANGNQSEFNKLIPSHLSLKEKEQVWNILTGGGIMKESKGDVNCLVVKPQLLNEMSAMGAGAVTGFAGPFKKKKKFNESDIIDRRKIMAEILLRERIRNILKEVFKSKTDAANLIKEHIRRLILEKKEVADTMHASTGINVLEDLLKRVIPQLEQDYKTLTSDKAQRDSFRAHILNAVSKSLTTADINGDAGLAPDSESDSDSINESFGVDEDIDVIVGNDTGVPSGMEPAGPGGDKFIDIDNKSKRFRNMMKKHKDFSIPGQNETGRNLAMMSYDKLEKNILDSYNILSDNDDQKVFYDYLLTNLKLYFDKFESELSSQVEEPEVDATVDGEEGGNEL